MAAALCAATAEGGTAVPGDCDGDGRVAVNELVIAVNISLGALPLARCTAIDRNGDGRVAIEELIRAVRHTLESRRPHQRAFVVTSSFMAGSFATIELDAPRAVAPSSAQRRVHSDAVVRTRDGVVYVLNRLFGDNLQVLDPDDGFRTRSQCSTGNGTNPHDIAFADDNKAYITLYDDSELLIVNPDPRPDCSDFVLGSIDLTPVADGDGIPDMDLMAVHGDRLYVSLQRLDINSILRTPAAPGAIAVIDTATDTLIDTIELSGDNPFAATKGLTVRNGVLYVALAGLFGVLDGGLERVDLATGRAEGISVSETDLGGDITDFALVSDRLAYAIVARRNFSAAVVAFDPADAVVLETLTEAAGFTLADIELDDRGELFVADRDRQRHGVRIYRAADGAPLTDVPINLGLAPFEIVFLP
jgi:hypothetical protein